MSEKDDKIFEFMTTSADKTGVDISPLKPAKKKYDSSSIHMTLAGSGFLPGPTGAAADLADALLYVSEGKPGEAFLAGLSILPAGSLLFRGVGGAKEVLKSFKKISTGKHLSKSNVGKIVDDYEEMLYNDFGKIIGDTKLVGSGKHKRAIHDWGDAPDITFTTTNPVEANKLYGDKFFRIEVDQRILKDMENSNLLKIFDGGMGPSGLRKAKHLIFKEGIKLENIRDLKMFQTYPEYIDFQRSRHNLFPHDTEKLMQQWRNWFPNR